MTVQRHEVPGAEKQGALTQTEAARPPNTSNLSMYQRDQNTRIKRQAVFAAAARPRLGEVESRKMFELHPDKKKTDEKTRLLMGPVIADIPMKNVRRRWPIWSIASPGPQFTVPTNPAACLNKLRELGFMERMTKAEVSEFVKYVRNIKIRLVGRERKEFFVTPFKTVMHVEFDLYELADELGLTCPEPRNCHWQYLTPTDAWERGMSKYIGQI